MDQSIPTHSIWLYERLNLKYCLNCQISFTPLYFRVSGVEFNPLLTLEGLYHFTKNVNREGIPPNKQFIHLKQTHNKLLEKFMSIKYFESLYYVFGWEEMVYFAISVWIYGYEMRTAINLLKFSGYAVH